MGILQLPMPIAANTGIIPNLKMMCTTDSLATVTTAGYLNAYQLEGYPIATTDVIQCMYSFNSVTNVGTLGYFTVSISNGVITLVSDIAEGNVVLPTIANHIATYTSTTGVISEDPATAISGGNIQAGLSGTAGSLTSFPATASKGSLSLTAVANTGNTATVISNAAMGQASTVSIPDPGASTANFIISAVSGGQTITNGGLTVSTGNITSGSSGDAGTFVSFPATASKGTLILAAVNNTGNTNTTISNAAMGQASVISIPDPAAATANFVIDSGTQQLAAGSYLKFDYGTATLSSNACTLNKQAGAVLTENLNTQAQYATYAFTITNSLAVVGRPVLVSLDNTGGSNTTEGMGITAHCSSGSIGGKIVNLNLTALSGTVVINYLLL